VNLIAIQAKVWFKNDHTADVIISLVLLEHMWVWLQMHNQHLWLVIGKPYRHHFSYWADVYILTLCQLMMCRQYCASLVLDTYIIFCQIITFHFNQWIQPHSSHIQLCWYSGKTAPLLVWCWLTSYDIRQRLSGSYLIMSARTSVFMLM